MLAHRTPNYIRCWQEVAAEIAQESDPKKLGDLADELNRLLYKDEQAREKHLPGKPSKV